MALLLFALARLTPIAWEAVAGELDSLQWSVLVINVLFMAWSEGYKGFQQRFSPRVAARVLYLYRNPLPIHVLLLAPLFCCGYFGAGRRTGLTLWLGTTAIVSLVLIVHRLDQPWRGIVDAGVVIGLTWGLVSFIAYVFRTFRTGHYFRSPNVTESYNRR
jgi:hypothetical protein